MSSFLDQMNEDTEKLESFQEEEIEIVKVNYFKKYGLPAIIILILGSIGWFFYRQSTEVVVPNLTGWTEVEVGTWSSENDIVIYYEEEYTMVYEDETVMSQETSEGTIIYQGDSIVVTYSAGADPSEVIEIPDIMNMTESQVEAWEEDNQLTGISYDYANSTIIPEGEVITYEFYDGTEDNFIRKNRLLVTISLGVEEVSDYVTVQSFIGLTETSLGKWATNNEIILDVTYVYDTYYDEGLVISQSVDEDYDILVGDTLEVTVSLGEAIRVVDFSYYVSADAESWAKTEGVDLIVVEEYSSSIPSGELISQSIEAGTEISPDDEIVVTYSIGKVKIYSYVGKSILDFDSFLEEVNNYDGELSYVINYQVSTKYDQGEIIDHEYINEQVNPGTTLEITVSLGDEITVPDFSDYSETEAKTWASDNSVTVQIQYEYAKSYDYGLLKTQSVSEGSIVNIGDTIELVYSIGQPNMTSFVDLNILDLLDYIDELNELNARLSYSTSYIYSDVYAEGDIVSHSYENSKVYPESSIAIVVSNGPGYVVPDFVNDASVDTLAEIQTAVATGGSLEGYNIAYQYVTDETATSGDVVSQSVTAGTAIGVNDLVIVYIAN